MASPLFPQFLTLINFKIMKNQWYKFLCGCLLVAILNSCEKEITSVKPVEQKIVVTSFISPTDSPIKVHLSLSNPLYSSPNGEGALMMKDAQVLIYEGNIQKQLIWNSQNKDFELDQSQFPILAGKTYNLQVKTANGKEVSAQTTVPYPVINPVFEFLGFKQSSKGTKEVFKFQLSDDGSQVNYYRFFVQIERTGQSQMGTVKYYDNLYLSDDKEFNGNVLEKTLEYKFYSNTDPSTFTNKYTGYLINCSEEYYKFHKIKIIDSDFTEGDPVPVYSNIKGGLGVFAGYNSTAIEKKN
jgi:Domain of unknown function (DUF4249)